MPQMNPLIDNPLGSHWKAHQITPLPLVGDSTFLRRITLDLAGRIPTVEELTAFSDNPDREPKIDQLLAADSFNKHWANLWTAMLNGYANAFDSDRESLRIWLLEQFRADRPYNEIVTNLVTATGAAAKNGAVNFLARYPGEEGGRVSRLFLGVQIDCARCHDHPFDRWNEDDFANMERFFKSINRKRLGNSNVEITNRSVSSEGPKFLTGARPKTAMWRDELALFMQSTNAFAKNFANRIWYQLMGRGIVHKPDDFNEGNPPSVPALLDSLADKARTSDWSLREMVREICLSDAYQRSSVTGEKPNKKSIETFAIRSIKPLTPEQWYASVSGVYSDKLPLSRVQFLQQTFGQQLDEDFAEIWLYRETVQQLMQQLALDMPTPAKTIDDVYRLILSRSPSPEDLQICENHSVTEVTFALLNSSEFSFNH